MVAKLKKIAVYNQEATSYIYRLLSMNRLDVTLKILKKMKSSRPEYRESIGYIVLEMVKQLTNKPNANQEIENLFEVSFR